jgi:hypothetical protein
MKERMRLLTLLVLLLLTFSGSALKPAAAATPIREDSVVIEKRKIVILRKGKFVRDFPERRRAVINYPFVRSGASAAVLRKVRSLLQIKNIFDTSLAEYRANTWLDEFDYEVNYNKNFILDITFTQNGMAAYPDGQTRHFAINLKTGDVIKARDVFRPEALKALAGMVDRKLQEEIKSIIKENAQDSSASAEEKDSLREQLEQLKFQASNLDDFAISDKGVTFLFDAGFPHVIQALEPVGQYFFTYSELRPYIKPDGQLGNFVR